MKILVIRFSSIGDIVLTTPVIRCLKQQLPEAEIHFLTKLKFKAVSQHNPFIDQFHYFDGDLKSVIKQLKLEQFDYVVDLHKNFRTFVIKKSLSVPAFTYKKETLRKFLLTKFKINLMLGKHIVKRNLETILPLGVKDDGKGLDYFISPTDEVPMDHLPIAHQFGYIGFVIGGSYYTKKLTTQQIKDLCVQIEFPILLLGGKEDEAVGQEVAAVDPIKIYNACGKFSLNQSAFLVQKSKLIISHDTGLQYVASAYGKKTIAIWGGTSPKLDVEPYFGAKQFLNKPSGFTPYKNFVVDLPCQPCSNFGTRNCPKKHFKCMRNHDLNAIASLANEWVRSGG